MLTESCLDERDLCQLVASGKSYVSFFRFIADIDTVFLLLPTNSSDF